MWRLVSVTDPTDVGATWASLESHPRIGHVATAGRERLTNLFQPGGPGAALADQALRAEPT